MKNRIGALLIFGSLTLSGCAKVAAPATAPLGNSVASTVTPVAGQVALDESAACAIARTGTSAQVTQFDLDNLNRSVSVTDATVMDVQGKGKSFQIYAYAGRNPPTFYVLLTADRRVLDLVKGSRINVVGKFAHLNLIDASADTTVCNIFVMADSIELYVPVSPQ